jgi:hypothetical protein
MQVAPGTIVALYYGAFFAIFYLSNKALTPSFRLLLALPSLLFVTLFPYFLEAAEFMKFLLTIVGFFTSFNIVDLVYLDPVEHLSFKEYMFFLSTSSRYPGFGQFPVSKETLAITLSPNINLKALARLGMAALKVLVFAVMLETIQKWDITQSYLVYLVFCFLLGGGLYVNFTVILDVVGIFWELVFNMKPKELFNNPILASSPRDFWSRRWNMFFRDFFHKMFFRNHKSISYLRSTLSALAIFIISGLLHEYTYWSIVGKFSGLNFLFFMIHGLATTGQVAIQMTFPVLKKIPRTVGIFMNLLFLLFTIPLFVGPYISSGYVHKVSLPFTLTPTLNEAVSLIVS